MKEMGKKIISIIIGMIIAILLIAGLLWILNRSLFQNPPLVDNDPNHRGATINITTNNSPPLQPEILHPADLNNGVNSENANSNNLTNNLVSYLNDNISSETRGGNNTMELYPDFDNITNNSNYSSTTTTEPELIRADKKTTLSTTTLTNKPKSAKKKTEPTKRPNQDDAIGNLIQDINQGKTNSRAPSKSKATGSYQVQMGSYSSQIDADKQKARLIMMNVPTKVIKTNVNGKQYFRVVTSQTVSKEEANKIKTNLRNKNIDSLIISQ